MGQAVTWSPNGKGALLFWDENGVLWTLIPGVPAPGGPGVWTDSGNPESHCRATVAQRTAVPKCTPGHHAQQEAPALHGRGVWAHDGHGGRGEPVGKG